MPELRQEHSRPAAAPAGPAPVTQAELDAICSEVSRRDGDPVLFRGVRVGTFRGNAGVPGGWYIETVSLDAMPPELAAIYRARAAEPIPWVDSP